MTHARPISDFLPLTHVVYHVLLSLAQSARHGYGIIKDVEAATDGRIRLLASPLYRRLRRLLDKGLIEDTGEAPAGEESEDGRRRYYRLTSTGRAVLAAEARRVTAMAADRRIRRLARMDPEGGHV
jgi:DNA-binding PadR family transcriptional regulator